MRYVLASLALAGILVGCGGDDSGAENATDDTVASVDVTPQGVQALTHSFTEPGTYTLTASGNYKAPGGGESLQVWFSFSGQGAVDGNAEPTYAVSGLGTASIGQSVDVTLTGLGPWQVTIYCRTSIGSGVITDLKLHTVEH